MQFCTFDVDMRPQAFCPIAVGVDVGNRKKGTNQAAWNRHTIVACCVVCALNT